MNKNVDIIYGNLIHYIDIMFKIKLSKYTYCTVLLKRLYAIEKNKTWIKSFKEKFFFFFASSSFIN